MLIVPHQGDLQKFGTAAQSDVMGGKACIRGLRVTVGMVVGQIAA